MKTAAVHDPFFTVVTASEFRRGDIADLAGGRCAAISVAGLVPEPVCTRIHDALAGHEFATFGQRRVYPTIMRFGVAISDFRPDGHILPEYWDEVARSDRDWRSLGLDFDPWRLCRDAIGAHWPGTVVVGRRSGLEFGPGVAREANQGFQVHFDDAIREFSGNLMDASIVAQFAFNLYVSAPADGGETVVWRHQWQPEDEQRRLPGSYGYDPAVVDGAESFEIKPRVGDALLFNPRFFHAVRPSRDSRRIALGFAVGMTDTGELWTWG